jgi:selenocysteine lyase/cysteine desulfurase
LNRDRFPGLRDGWARLDGPAGTQMLDAAIGAMDDWMRSGHNANHGGLFAAARHTDELVAATRAAVGTLLGGDRPAWRSGRA